MLKKIAALTVCGALVLGLSGCGGQQDAAEPSGSTVTVETADAFSQLGFSLSPPEGAEELHFAFVDETTAQIKFKWDNRAWVLRKAQTAGDISGVRCTDSTTSRALTINGEQLDLLLQTAEAGGRLAVWSVSPDTYALYTPEAVDDDTLAKAAEQTARQNPLE